MDVQTTLLFVLAAVAVVVVLHWVAEKTALPDAALLTLAGIGYAFLPGPNVELDPHVVLTLVIPPLLYNAALDSSLLGIRRNLRTVVSLSVSLVVVTAVAVGVGFDLLVAGATLGAGVALGAAIAPPDPVAALAVGRRVGLQPRLVTVIQGEGLLNDATALTLFTVAVTAATSGDFSTWSAIGQFIFAAAGGVAIGLVVSYAVRWMRRWRTDPMSLNVVSLATPFAAYLAGEALHVSGVLAVVIAGLVVGHDGSRTVTGASRLQVNAVWRLVAFLLEGLVFLLIGQQLPAVIRELGKYETPTVVTASVVSVGVVLLLRPLWLSVTQLLPRSLHTRLGGAADDAEDQPPNARLAHAEGRLTAREVVVLSWAGTRGVISLVAIFTLPQLTDAGDPFPDRELLQFCTMLVVLVTLVGQGVTFAPLVRALGLRANAADQALLRNRAREAAVQAGLDRLAQIEREEQDVDERAIATLRTQLETRLARYRGRSELLENADEEIPYSPQYEAAVRVSRAVLEAEREELLRLRDTGRLPDSSQRVLEWELDLQENLLPTRPTG